MSSKIIVLLLTFLALWSTAFAAPLPANTSENPAAALTKRERPGMWRLECTTRKDGSKAMEAYDCWRRYGTYCDEYGRMWMKATLEASKGTGDCSSDYRNCYCDQRDPDPICSYQMLAINRCNLVNNTAAGNFTLNPNHTVTGNSPHSPLKPNVTLSPNATLTPNTTITPNTTLTPNKTSSTPNSTVVTPKSAGDSLGTHSSVLVTVLLFAVAFGFAI